MKYKPIIIVAGEPNSIFLEIFLKSIKKIKIKHPLILIVSARLLKLQMKKLRIKKINILNNQDLLKFKYRKIILIFIMLIMLLRQLLKNLQLYQINI